MQFLYDYYSCAKCINASDRCTRLCRQIPGGTKYEQALLPFHNDLVAKDRALDDATKNTQAAHDAVRLCDTLLDEDLIKINHRSGEYDTAHTGSFTRTTLFPNGNYGEVTRMNIYKEPAKAAEIAVKLESFGETHALYPLAAELRIVIAASEKAISDEVTVGKAEDTAKALAELAKLALIRKYNSNYYKAADEGGKAFAEKLFPDLGGNESKEVPPTEEKK